MCHAVSVDQHGTALTRVPISIDGNIKLFLRIGVSDATVPHGGKHDRMMQSCFQAING